MRLRPSLLFVAAESACRVPVARSLALTRVLAARFDITLATNAPPPRGAEAEGIPCVHLPTVPSDPAYQPGRPGRRPAARARLERTRILHELYRSIRPRVLMVERSAIGSGTLLADLEPILREAHESSPSETLVCASVLDDLVNRFDCATDADGDRLERYFHAVLVHGDAGPARAGAASGRMPIYYTGFVSDTDSAPGHRPRLPQGTFVLSAGHDPSGMALIRAAIDARAMLPARGWPPLTVVAGPRTPEGDWRALQAACERHAHVQLRRSVPHLATELRRAAGSISDCGYHAAIDVLRSRVPALVVPTGDPSGLQMRRAQRLAAIGAVRVLPAAEVNASRLAHELVLLADFTPSPERLDFSGAERSARILETLCLSSVARAV